ncbi:MAG: TolC family protein, partial [Elusimicrobiota bacterium]
NPEIEAARKLWEARTHRIVSAATPRMPRLDVERMFGSSPFSGEEKSFSLTQELPFPTTLLLRRAAASREAQGAEQAYRAKVREVLSRTRWAYAMLHLAHKSLEIIGENTELMRRFAKSAESKYASGRASQSDALKAQVELTKMLNMAVQMEAEKESAQAMLGALLGRRGPRLALSLADMPVPVLERSLEELEAEALSGRPELKAAAFAEQRARDALALGRSEFLPDLMLQYRRRSDPMRGTTQDGVVGFMLPLWFWKPAAMVREAQAEKGMAEAELEGMRVMTLSEVRAAYAQALAAKRLFELYRTSLIPQAEAALSVAEAGYQSDKSSFLDLLDAQRSLLDFRVERLRAGAEYERRLSELERAVGHGL